MIAARGRVLLIWAAVVGLLVCGAFVALRVVRSAVLRADPNDVPSHPRLMQVAAFVGAVVYREHCAACHGAAATGDRVRGIPDLTDDDWLYGSGRVSDIEQVIDFGIRAHNPRTHNLANMPAFAQALPSATEKNIPPLTPGDIRDVVEYLRYVQGKQAIAVAVPRGSSIYHGRGGCYDCHSQDAAGDAAIGAPNLTDGIWLLGDGSRASLFASIARGYQGVCPAWRGKLSPSAVRDAALYVYSLSHLNRRHTPGA